MITKEGSNSQIHLLRHEIVQINLSIKALIHDIQNCYGSLEDLNELNVEGRKKIAALRNDLLLMKSLVPEADHNEVKTLSEEVLNYEKELASTVASFQKANVNALLTIEKANREKLLGNDEESLVRNRKKKDREALAKTSSNITDQLLSISRNLADTTQRSGDTLDTLITSSSTVDGTRSELDNTGSVIAQSGKLLAKYGRREQTDKVLILFAFIFFLVCVFYVLQKRLF